MIDIAKNEIGYSIDDFYIGSSRYNCVKLVLRINRYVLIFVYIKPVAMPINMYIENLESKF